MVVVNIQLKILANIIRNGLNNTSNELFKQIMDSFEKK